MRAVSVPAPTMATTRRRARAFDQWLTATLWLACIVTPAWGEDWPQFRGTRGDGTWQSPPIPEIWPAEGLKPRWKVAIGGGYAGISVVGHRVISMDRPAEPANTERIFCLDASNGAVLWQHSYPAEYKDLDYGNGPRAQPTIVGQRVFTVGSLGDVFCLDLQSGTVLWQKHLQRDFGGRLPMWGFASSPVLHNEHLILVAGGPDAGVVSVHPETGEERWRSSTDEAGYCTPLIVPDLDPPQVVHWSPSHIRGLRLLDGQPLWSSRYEVTYGVSIAKPVLHEGLVLVAGYWEGSKAIRLTADSQSGERAWEENRYLRGLMSQPLYREGHIYLLDKQYGLTCFRLSDGKKLWDDKNQLTPRDRNPQASLVWLEREDRAIALNAEGELVLMRLNPQGYHETSRSKVIGFTWAHPAFAGDLAFARSDSELVCVPLLSVNPSNSP